VLVDTIVNDKPGEYVHCLSAKDFRLYEDNKEQTIQSLEKSAATSGPRYLVLFFGGMEDSDRIRGCRWTCLRWDLTNWKSAQSTPPRSRAVVWVTSRSDSDLQFHSVRCILLRIYGYFLH
jgi:hypothetical protein